MLLTILKTIYKIYKVVIIQCGIVNPFNNEYLFIYYFGNFILIETFLQKSQRSTREQRFINQFLQVEYHTKTDIRDHGLFTNVAIKYP